MPAATSLVLRGRLRTHLRQIGRGPQLEAPKSGRNPGKFHSAVQDLVWRTETPIGSDELVRRAGAAWD